MKINRPDMPTSNQLWEMWPHFILRFRIDARECVLIDDYYVHILNPDWRIHKDRLGNWEVSNVIEQ